MKPEQFNFAFRDIRIGFSDHTPSDPRIAILLSETPLNASRFEPGLGHYTNDSGRTLYINCYPSIRADHLRKLAGAITNIMFHETDPIPRRARDHLELASDDATRKARQIVESISQSIMAALSLAQVQTDGLYTSSELIPIKRDKSHIKGVYLPPTISARTKYIDHNVRNLFRQHRLYAGLAFLGRLVESLRYGIGISFTESPSANAPHFILYTSSISWYFENDRSIDGFGETVNKIIECALVLLREIGNTEIIGSLYKELCDSSIEFNSGSLISITNALITHEETEILRQAVNQLKALEPKHPVIEQANRVIRRTEIFDQVTKSGLTGIHDIKNMSGLNFEQFLESHFARLGFRVERTKASGDFGADLLIETQSGTRVAVQSKRHNRKTNLKAVQEVVGSLSHYAADFGIVIGTSGFFPSAIELAKTNNVELWDEDRVICLIAGDLSFSLLSDN